MGPRHDDGQLHPRPRDEVFPGALRGPVAPLAERARITRDSLTSLRAVQVGGAGAFTVLCWCLAAREVLADGGGTVTAAWIVLGVLVPLFTRAAVQVQLRNEFWCHCCASRGLEPASARDAAELLPANANRSPLLGTHEERVVELAARRALGGRDAVVGCVIRPEAPPDEVDPRATATMHRLSFAVMALPPVAAARWAGTSIRGDHHARRPLSQRAMVGTTFAGATPGATAHVSADANQDPHVLQRLADARMDRYVAAHPMDVDLVGDMLVVTRDGYPVDADALDDLCRDALLLHELVVGTHELSSELPEAAPEPVDEAVIDVTREGWSRGTMAA